jgi:hypothetical protein
MKNLEELEELINDLLIFFDYESVNVSRLAHKAGLKEYKKFEKALNEAYKIKDNGNRT